MKEWIIKKNRELFKDTQEVMAEIIKERFSMEEFSANVHDLLDPFLLKNMRVACETIIEAIRNNVSITVFGDYDVDGLTSSYVVFSLLRFLVSKLGSTSKVVYYIPDREAEGYGLNCNALDKIHNYGCNLVITVDCGISNVKEVEYAKSLGMTVIVTDHHDIPAQVPDTTTINCKDGQYPFSKLSGCGVAFKLMEALYQTCSIERTYVYQFLDIVALSTIADIVPIIGENRIIVKFGLMLLNENVKKRNRSRAWLNTILDIANNKDTINTYSVAFVIAPRLNSVGRLSSAANGLRMMFESDQEKLNESANQINCFNEERKEIQDRIIKLGRSHVEENGLKHNLIFVCDEPAGVVGNAASNLKDMYYVPTLVLSRQEDGTLKGSARSIYGVDYFHEILEKNRDLLIKGGGHAMAAGLSMYEENVPILRDRIDAMMEEKLKTNPTVKIPKCHIECELYSSDITYHFYKKVIQLEPYGEGNPRPIFMMKGAQVTSCKGVPKDEPKHLQISFAKDDSVFKAILFKRADLMSDFMEGGIFDIAFTLNLNEWMGSKEVQLTIEDYKKAE